MDDNTDDECECQNDYCGSLERVRCGDCSGVMDLIQEFVRERRQNGKKFHCAYCDREISWTKPAPPPEPPKPWWRFW